MADDDAQQDAGSEFQPLVQLPEVKTESGENEEETLFKMRCKLYCFVKEDVYGGEVRQNFWRERGTGDVKLLKHKTHGKVRLLMRQEKTLKICANHLVSPQVELQENCGSDKSWVFTSSDFADEEVKTETFAIKFGSSEKAQKFKAAVEEAKAINDGGAAGAAAAPAAEEAEEAGEASGEASGEDLNKLVDQRNASALKRRDSHRLMSAQADPEHDSDEEDVDEGSAERLKKTVGDHTGEEAATGIKLAQGMAAMKVACGGFSVKDVEDPDVKAAAEFAVEALKKEFEYVASLLKIAEASSQVVAGVNFMLKIHVACANEETNVFTVKVFRPLPHTGNPMELSQHEHLGKL